MYEANSQNTLLRIRTELAQCSYNPNMKDFLANMIQQAMNFPKRTQQPRHFIRNMGVDKIIMVWYPMNVPFMGKSFSVPLQIFFMKNIPYEPPQIFIEVVQGSAPNPKNQDIDINTRRVMTNTLKNWNQYSIIENAMNEIFASFSNTFPIYKVSSNPKPANQYSGYGNNNPAGASGGSFYNVLNNEVNNNYNQIKYGPTNYNGYQPPATNFYGRSMTIDKDKNNDAQSNTFGGGIYDKNPNTNTYGQGGGIYDKNVNTFGQGGIYANQNKSPSYIPPSKTQGAPSAYGQYGNNNQYVNNNQYGGPYGQYGNNNNQYGNNSNQYGNNSNQYGGPYGQYGNNNNNQNQNQFGRGGIYSNNDNKAYNPPQSNYMAPQSNPDEDFKNILVNEVAEKISKKLIDENKRLNSQNEKMKDYKSKLSEENSRMEKFVNDQGTIKYTCEEDMGNINKKIKEVQDYCDKNKVTTLSSENCLTYLDVPDQNALKIIAKEVTYEEMILIVRKAFEKKKISFQDAIAFTRNSTRDLFTIKFLKDKVVKKYDRF